MEDQKFTEDCLKEKTVTREPGVIIISDTRKRDSLFKGALGNSDYFLKGAEITSETDVPYLAITLGFFAMEQRTRALALISNFYEIKNHICAQIFLSKIIKRKDLAKQLSKAWELRLAYNYRMDLNVISDTKEVEVFMTKILNPFILEIDDLIEKEKNNS